MTRVYLVRHGTTEWNTEEIFRGRANCKLNGEGQAEAQALAEYFRDTEFKAIYSSPLSRAEETALAIAKVQGLPVIPDAAFIDMDFGGWTGLSLKEVKRKYADLYQVWRERPQDAIFPGGENLTQVKARAWEGLLRVARESEDKTVLIVAHRVVTKILICAALGMDNEHFWQVKQDTTAVNCLEYRLGFFVVSLMNDTCHLKTISSGFWKKDF